jgi:hypothetical protein
MDMRSVSRDKFYELQLLQKNQFHESGTKC